jgi:hypothetical protein
MFGGKCNTLFITKCLLKQKPFTYVFGTMLLSIGVFGWMLMIAEAPLDRILNDGPKHSFQNACWVAICTMTTVGYGDVYPRTELGRLTAFGCALFGVIVISLLVVTFNQILTMDSPESQSYTVLKRLHIKDLIKNSAIRILVTINRKGGTDMNAQFERFSKIKQHIDEFRSLRRAYKQVAEPNIIDELGKSFSSVIGHVTDVKDMIIDQNEWYEEIFYGDEDSNGSQSDGSEIHSIGLSTQTEDVLENMQMVGKSMNPSKFAPHYNNLAEEEEKNTDTPPRNIAGPLSLSVYSPGNTLRSKVQTKPNVKKMNAFGSGLKD